MRILWFNHRDPENPKAGGAERDLREIGSRLVARGHEVEVVSAAWNSALPHAIVDGIRVTRVSSDLVTHLATPLILRERPRADVIVDDLAHVAPWCSPWFTDLPVVAFFHHLHARTLPGQVPMPAAGILVRVERRYPQIYRGCSIVTESCQGVEDLRHLGFQKEQVVRIPPGVEADRFETGPKSAEPLFVYFGGMRAYKRPEQAILAFAEVSKTWRSARLVVVGNGPSQSRVSRLVRELGLSDSVQLLGRISDRELAAVLASSWVNIHCSLAEGWGLSILEASASGVPTVAFDTPGVHEAIREGVNGYLVADGDSVALSSALSKAAESVVDLSVSSRAYAETLPWEPVAAQWETLLSAVVEGKSK